MRLHGYIAFVPLEFCFAIPVFEASGQLYFQSLGETGKIVGYEKLDGHPVELTRIPKALGSPIQGQAPIYVYLSRDRQITSGTKEVLQPLLMELLASSQTPLFSKLEITVFLKDRDLFNRYVERIQDDISQYNTSYKGRLVLEGLNPGEPSIVITTQPQQTEVLRAIKLNLPTKERLIESIVTNSSPTIRAMVYSLGGNEDLANDIIQDTFVAFLEHVHAGTIRAESRISTFVYGIARNKTLSVLRRRAQTMIGRLEEQNEEATSLGFEESHETAMIMEERLLFTQQLLSQLAEESTCVQLLRARFQPSFTSNADLASQFGYKDAGVVSAQIHNCKKHLVRLIATDPILLCKAMDLLDDVHQLEPLVSRYADRLKDIFQHLQGQMDAIAEAEFTREMGLDSSLARLVMALQPRFGH